MQKIGIISLLLCFQCIYLNAQDSNTQKVNIDSESISLDDVIEEISTQCEIEFSFNSKKIDLSQKFSFKAHNADLDTVLKLLKEKTDLNYAIVENQVILQYQELSSRSLIKKYKTISGFISDQATGETMIGAIVSTKDRSRGTFSNEYGYYVLQLPEGSYELQFSYVGYETKTVSIGLKNNKKIDAQLGLQSINLPDVIVDETSKNILDAETLDHIDLSPQDLNLAPEFAGESGLVKGLQSLPGIKMHSDGSAFYYVRGGEKDQNLIIIDDAPIYNPSHMFGFYSIIIPDFAKSIKVYKSDMPSSIGDRLSSIIDVRTRDGNRNNTEFSGAFNPLINRFTIETPFIKKKGSIFTSLRFSNFRWLYNRSAPDANLSFSDFSFKWNYRINENNRVFFTTIISNDNFTDNPPLSNIGSGIRWGNFATSLRWNHIYSNKLFSNTTIYTGNYAYRLFSDGNSWKSGLSTFSVKSDFTLYSSPQLESKFGIESQFYSSDPGTVSVDTAIGIFPEIHQTQSSKYVLYFQSSYDYNDQLKFRAGLRFVHWANHGPDTYYSYDKDFEVSDTTETINEAYHRYSRLDPRLSVQYQLNDNEKFKLSFGRYHQYLQLISNSVSPFNSLEVWLPAGPNLLPQSMNQFALDYLKKFSSRVDNDVKRDLEFAASLYYKKFKHQIEYQDHPNILVNPFLEGELRTAEMQTYGLELMIKKSLGKFSGFANYTLSKALKKSPYLNDGKNYPAYQDRPHDFSFMLHYHFSKRLNFTGYWTWYSGSTFSSPTGFYKFNGRDVPILDEKNNDRLPAYNRLDLSVKYKLNKNLESRWNHELNFSIYNALGHKNIVAVNFNKIEEEDNDLSIKSNVLSENSFLATQADLIRFFPSLTYKFNFK